MHLRTPPLILALALSAVAPAAAAGATAPPLTVSVKPASGEVSSYFDLRARPGRLTVAGRLELRNPTARPVRVRLDPVGGLTAGSLGSAYRQPGGAQPKTAGWMRLERRRVLLAPRGRTSVRVDVAVPSGRAPGEHLTGISVQAVGAPARAKGKGNLAISNVQRYAVGLVTRVPGPRKPLITLTEARIDRQPSGLAVTVRAKNIGNAIVRDVEGTVTVGRGGRTLARADVGPGTFVSNTSVSFPVAIPREQPREGAEYRVRAKLRYAGRVTRLDRVVRFGRRSAVRQEQFGGPPARRPGDLPPAWAIALGVALALGALVLVALRRRRRSGRHARRAATRALEQATAGGALLTVIHLSGPGLHGRAARATVRRAVRGTDRVLTLDSDRLVILAPTTSVAVAGALATDLGHHVARATGRPPQVRVIAVDASWHPDDVLAAPAARAADVLAAPAAAVLPPVLDFDALFGGDEPPQRPLTRG